VNEVRCQSNPAAFSIRAAEIRWRETIKKLTLATTTALLLVAGRVQAEELRPLAEAAVQESRPTMLVYIVKRCAAAHASVSARIGNSTLPQDKELKEVEDKVAAQFLSIGHNIITKAKLADTDEILVRDVSDMSASYLRMMQSSYVATGNAIGDQMKADILLCSSLLEN
jgi:hypothetical protein